MKKLFLTFYVLLAMLTLTACGSSDKTDEPASGGSIVGTWLNSAKEINDLYKELGVSAIALYQFKSDGTWIQINEYKYNSEYAELYGIDHEVEIYRGTYRVSGNKLSMTITDVGENEGKQSQIGYTEVVIFKIAGNKLQVTSTGSIIVSTTLTKVSDSSINQYL